jgi:hypothetical protein
MGVAAATYSLKFERNSLFVPDIQPIPPNMRKKIHSVHGAFCCSQISAMATARQCASSDRFRHFALETAAGGAEEWADCGRE